MRRIVVGCGRALLCGRLRRELLDEGGDYEAGLAMVREGIPVWISLSVFL